MSQWHDFDANVALARRSASRLCEVEKSARQEHQATLDACEALRSRCSLFECRVDTLTGAETRQRAQLQAAQQKVESLEQESAHLEHELSKVVTSDQETTTNLRMQLRNLQEAYAKAEHRSAEALKQSSASQELLTNSERRVARLEMKLARKIEWREAAEQHIKEMVVVGEGLEMERAQLRHKLSESRREQKGASERTVSMHHAMEQEQQLSELLQARSLVLEEDNASLRQHLQHERHTRLEDASRSHQELRALKQEEANVSAALNAVGDARGSELQAAQAARAKIMADWSRERDQWSRHSSEMTVELQQQLCTLRTDLEASRRTELAEMTAVAQARKAEAAALPAKLQEEAAAMRKAVRAEFSGEAELCREMACQLEHRLAQAQELQEGLEEFASTSPEPEVPASQPCSSGFATPQLRELDAYAELVERLRLEVAREREEREATGRSLESLRGSYRLLLQRVSSTASLQVAA